MADPGPAARTPVDKLSAQAAAILTAWGLAPTQVEGTTRVMVAADLRGIESHGVSTLSLYDDFRRWGRLTLNPEIRVVRESPVTALLDGGGLGHAPGLQAMDLAVEKCARAGVSVVAVRNSNHFGAAGVYALEAVRKGFIGIAMTNVWRPGIVPTHGTTPMFGTNPIAFAAPAGRNQPFCLDMATSTVAFNKIKLANWAGKPIPVGWAMDGEGKPTTDSAVAAKHICLTPLGGVPAMSSHKGYGLATMVEILAGTLAGASFSAIRNVREPEAERYNVGHFFMALDPGAFRGEDDFKNDLDAMIDALHAVPPANPDQPVLVAGDPEQAAFEDRTRNGIPLSEEVRKLLERLAREARVPWMLG
jgi:LDH2 family malate/lactate/ureidoglycolate dehydrogenase